MTGLKKRLGSFHVFIVQIQAQTTKQNMTLTHQMMQQSVQFQNVQNTENIVNIS